MLRIFKLFLKIRMEIFWCQFVQFSVELWNKVKEKVPVPKIDAPQATPKPLDISKMDMKMTIEVENDHYAPLAYDTPPQENQASTDLDMEERDRQETQRRETELIRSIDMFRKWAQNPGSEDLRNAIRGNTGPADLRNRNKDLRQTLRRASGHDDLRNCVLNRDQDLRVQINRRRARSVPTNMESELNNLRNKDSLLEEIRLLEQSVIHQFDLLDFSTARTEEQMRNLRDQMASSDTKSQKEHDSNVTSAPDSFSEGEVQPSEEEMTYVRYSETESSSRDPQPGPSGTQYPRPPKTPSKTKGTNKNRSPIKYPSNTPVKNDEDVPLSRLTYKPACAKDLRTRLAEEPESPPRNHGTIRSRLGPRPGTRPQEVWNAFLPGQYPINNRTHQIYPWQDAEINQDRHGTPHHGRQFITGRPILRDEGTMTDQEPETTAQDNGEHNDFTQTEEADLSKRGNNKEN